MLAGDAGAPTGRRHQVQKRVDQAGQNCRSQRLVANVRARLQNKRRGGPAGKGSVACSRNSTRSQDGVRKEYLASLLALAAAATTANAPALAQQPPKAQHPVIIGDDIGYWRTISAVASWHRVYAFDMLGHGLTDKPQRDLLRRCRACRFTIEFLSALARKAFTWSAIRRTR